MSNKFLLLFQSSTIFSFLALVFCILSLILPIYKIKSQTNPDVYIGKYIFNSKNPADNCFGQCTSNSCMELQHCNSFKFMIILALILIAICFISRFIDVFSLPNIDWIENKPRLIQDKEILYLSLNIFSPKKYTFNSHYVVILCFAFLLLFISILMLSFSKTKELGIDENKNLHELNSDKNSNITYCVGFICLNLAFIFTLLAFANELFGCLICKIKRE